MKSNYIFIKTDGHDASGEKMSSMNCCKILMKYGAWPLWERTPHRKHIKKGDNVLIYAGNDTKGIVGSAQVLDVVEWSRDMEQKYPLVIDGVPSSLVILSQVDYIDEPVLVKPLLDELDLSPKNKAKWGMAFMAGVKKISDHDYSLFVKSDLRQQLLLGEVS